MRRLVAAAALIAFCSCGKRGDPRPPVPIIPQATSDLSIAQRAARIVLQWSYPSVTTAGKSLAAVRRVVLYRYVEELPANATTTVPRDTAPPEPAIPDAVTAFSRVPTLAPAQFAKLSQRVDSIESANLASASAGAKLEYEDTPSLRSSSGRPIRVTYAVVTEGSTARSEFSNLVSIVPLDVAVAPAGLTSEPGVEGVVLKWTRPEESVTGGKQPVIAGYNIYRLTGTETTGDLPAAVNPSPIQATTYTDTPPYGTHNYKVAAVASAGPPRVESDPSPAVSVTFKDLVAPPAPATLSVLVETRIVRMVWDPVDVPDLQGYNVYRWEGTGRLKLTPGPAKQTHFGDEGPAAGITYTYGVTAVDKSGNESSETKSQPIIVPKTP